MSSANDALLDDNGRELSDTLDTRLWNKELGSKLDDGIKKAFTFSFGTDQQCQPDDKSHYVRDITFHVNGHLVVLYYIQLQPGTTIRALDVNTGDLNVFTQDAKFEIDIPTVGGYFYVVSEDKSVKQPVHIKGTFKINYGTAIAKGITSFFLNDKILSILNMAIDFELAGKPTVILDSREDDGSLGILDSNRAENGTKMAEVLWPSVHALLYWLLRDKLWNVSSKISWDKVARKQFFCHEKRRRDPAAELLKDIVARANKKLGLKKNRGRVDMPDIDVMVAPRHEPKTWGRFKATSGWLGNLDSMSVKDHTAVHARNINELVIVGQINFDDWQYCYDEFRMEASTGDATGQIMTTLDDNEAFVTITATRTEDGTVLKHARFQYINATANIDNDITKFGDFDWLSDYVSSWMSGLVEEGKSALNKTMTDCLNDVISDVDLFAYWDRLHKHHDVVRGFEIGSFRFHMSYHNDPA